MSVERSAAEETAAFVEELTLQGSATRQYVVEASVWAIVAESKGEDGQVCENGRRKRDE